MRVAVVVAVDRAADRVEAIVQLTPREVQVVPAVVALGELQWGLAVAPPQLAQQERTVSAAAAAGLVTVTGAQPHKVRVALVARELSLSVTRLPVQVLRPRSP